MRTCELCQTEKRDEAFRKFGRGRKKVCTDCESGIETEGEAIADPASTSPALLIPAGFGVAVRQEDGRLILEQDGQDTDGEPRKDTIVLARHEALAVLDWISKFAEAA